MFVARRKPRLPAASRTEGTGIPLDAIPDHVAVAVPDFDVADRRWRDQLGGRWVSWYHNKPGGFRSRQLKFRGGAKLELLQPSEVDPSPDNFVRAFLARHSATVHHVTLKVPSLAEAVKRSRAAGFDVVGVNVASERWKEAFLRPSEVGGVVVQLAQSPNDDGDWAAMHDYQPQEPGPDAARLRGARLTHRNLDRSTETWSFLGADVAVTADRLVVRWPGQPLALEIVADEGPPRPLGVVMEGCGPLDPHPDLGPAVLVP